MGVIRVVIITERVIGSDLLCLRVAPRHKLHTIAFNERAEPLAASHTVCSAVFVFKNSLYKLFE